MRKGIAAPNLTSSRPRAPSPSLWISLDSLTDGSFDTSLGLRRSPATPPLPKTLEALFAVGSLRRTAPSPRGKSPACARTKKTCALASLRLVRGWIGSKVTAGTMNSNHGWVRCRRWRKRAVRGGWRAYAYPPEPRARRHIPRNHELIRDRDNVAFAQLLYGGEAQILAWYIGGYYCFWENEARRNTSWH